MTESGPNQSVSITKAHTALCLGLCFVFLHFLQVENVNTNVFGGLPDKNMVMIKQFALGGLLLWD